MQIATLFGLFMAASLAFAKAEPVGFCARRLSGKTAQIPARVALAEQAKQSLAALLLGQMAVPEWPAIKDESLSPSLLALAPAEPAAFDLERFAIYISYSAFTGKNPVGGKQAYYTALMHELSHVVFMANFGRYHSRWDRFFQFISQGDRQSGWWRLLHWRPAPLKLIEISRPYQELFADLLPVIAQRDPWVIAHAVGFVDGAEAMEPRLFNQAVMQCNFSHAETHDIFAPARAFLWSHYFADENNRAAHPRMIAAVFETLAQEIIERDRNRRLKDISPAEMNLRLIRKLEKNLAVHR